MTLDDLLNVARGLCDSTPLNETTKAMPTGEVECGIHVHALERERDRTKIDGAHRHVFRLDHDVEINGQKFAAGTVLVTEEDGVHEHVISLFAEGPLESEHAQGGEHRHTLLVGDEELFTTVMPPPGEELHPPFYGMVNGAHSHSLQRSHTAFDGTHQHELRLADGTVLYSLTGNQLWQWEGAPPQAGAPPAPPASAIAAAKAQQGFARPFERDTLEKDHRCAFCVSVADHAIVVHGGRAFTPTCAGHVAKAKVEAHKSESPVVAVRRLVKRRAFELRKSGEIHGQLPALKVYDPRSIVNRLAQGLPVGLLSVRKRQERVGKQQALVNEIAVLDHPYVWGVVRQEDPIEIGSIDELAPDLREGIAEAVVKSFADEERIFYLPLALDIAFESPVPLRKVPEGRRFARHVDFDRDVEKIDGRQLSMDELFDAAVEKGVDELLNETEITDFDALSNNQLDALTNQLHAIFGRVEERGYTKQQVVDAGMQVFREYVRRDRPYPKSDELAEAISAAFQAAIAPEEETAKRDDLLAQLAKVSIADKVLPAVYLVGETAPFEVVVCGPVDEDLFEMVRSVVLASIPATAHKSVQFKRSEFGVHGDAVKLFDMSWNANQQVVKHELAPHAELVAFCTKAQGEKCLGRWSYQVQDGVFRGELQIDNGDESMSWLIALAKSDVGAIDQERLTTLAKSFSLHGTDVTRSLVAPSRTYATPKIGKSADSGIMATIATPIVEFGVCTATCVEMFLTGDPTFSGRLVFKRLQDEGWVVRVDTDAPFVLAKGVIPSLEHSELPESLAAAIPPAFRWWNCDWREEAIATHKMWLAKGNQVLFTGQQFAFGKTQPLQTEVEHLSEEDLLLEELAKRVRLIQKSTKIQKATDGSDERYVFGVVLVPEDVDSQGDIYNADTVRNAAHSFLEHFGGTMKIMHQGRPVPGLVVLESYVSKIEETHGEEVFPVGTWFMAVRVRDEDLWEAIKRGDFTGFSIGGTAMREPLAQTQ